MTELPLPPRLHLRRDVVIDGRSDDELSRLVRANAWTRVRRGAYVDGPLPASELARHALLVVATIATLRRPAVISHQSAAALIGLPLWGVPLDRVHITRRPPASSQATGPLRAHVARLRDDEVVTVAGLEVTDSTRTVLDLARSLPFETAVVVVDAALNAKLVSSELARQQLADLAGTRGSRHAARVIAFADQRSESVGESRSRILLAELGLAPSALQHRVLTPDGEFVGRADFAWEEAGVIGEFDGRVKYGRLLCPGQAAGDVVFEEKRREDAMRDAGWEVVRWTWRDLATPERIGDRVRRARDRGRRRRA